MKQGSIVAPIILILIGGLFLANNLRLDVPTFEFLGRYWPFLLIGWGLVRLVEIVIWAVRGKPLPTSGVSGGEWFLVIFLSMAGSALYAFHSHGWGPARFRIHGIEMFGEAYDYPIDEKKASATNVKRVIIENLRGNTRITGGDSAEVRVSGRKTVRALSHDEATAANGQTTLELLEQGDTIVVRTNQNRSQQERYISADLEVAVPKGVSIQARGRNGDFDVNDLAGSVEIESDNAGVRMENIGGAVRVNVRHSDVVRATGVTGEIHLQGRGNDVELENVEGQVTIEGSWGGELQFRRLAKPLRFQGNQAEFLVQRVNGEVRLGRGFLNGESIVGPVVLRAHSNGCCDVRLSDFNNALELDVERGDLELRPGNPVPKMDVQLENGNVELVIPAKARFNLKARVEKGETENDFGDQVHQEDTGRGGLMTANVADGPPITITADRGTILVRKSEDAPPSAPLTPQPPSAPRPKASEE